MKPRGMRALVLTLCTLCLTLIVAGAWAQTDVRFESRADVRPGWWEARAVYPVFAGSSAVQRAASAAFRSDALARLAAFQRQARADLAGAGKPAGPYTYRLTPTVGVARPDLVSGYLTADGYAGGPHPNTDYHVHSFGLVGGRARALTLEDLLSADVRAADFVTQVVLPALNAAKAARGAPARGRLDARSAESFVVTPAGITWLFAPSRVGAYAEGGYVVKIPFSGLRRWLDRNGPLKPLLSGRDDSGPRALSGALVYRERIALPPGAVVEMRLVRAPGDAASRPLATKTFPAKNPPIPFTFPFESAGYLEIEIRVDGRVWFRSPEAIPVPPTGWDGPREILLRRGG